MSKLSNLLTKAAEVRDATEQYENTAAKVGGLFVSIIQAIIETVPETLIDGDTVSCTTSESNFIISMKKRLDDGSLVPITITIPAASTANAGLLTPALLAELRAGINSASNAAATAQNGANSANRILSEVITSISTMRDGMATIETKVIEISTNVEGLSSEVSNILEQIGQPFGIAPLDALGKVPATHLPPLALGYTEDSAFPGNEGKELQEIVERLENDLNDSSSVGNIFNVSVEVPIEGYYVLCDTVNPHLSAVHAAWEKGKAVNGLIISFEMSAGKWKTYQYIGKAKDITQEAWIFPDNWADFGSLAAGSENFIIVDNIIPRGEGYYTIGSALEALRNYELQTGVVYRKDGLVISYRTAERTFETMQFTGSINDIYSAPDLWKEFGSGSSAVEVEITDTPSEGGTSAFSSGGAYTHLPVKIDVNTEQTGVVKLQLQNESGEAIGDEVQFAVGTGTGDGSATILAIAFENSPLYGAFGGKISTRAAIRSVTDNNGIQQENDIETIELVDRDSGITLFRRTINQASSANLEDYTFELNFTEFFTAAGVRRFKLVATANGGSTASRNITVTAVDVTCTCTQTLQYNPANPVTTTTEVAYIPLFKFANNQGEISTQIDIKIDNEWRPLTTVVVKDTYSHNILLQPVALGLSHGSYPIRIQGTDTASGTKGNTVYTAIMVLEHGNNTPLVSLRYDDRSNGNVKVYETLSLDIACYNPIATQTHVNIMLNNEQISQVLALNTRSYTFSQQVKGFSGDSLAYQLVAGNSCSDIVNLLVNGSVIEAELTPGAIYSFDFSSRTNDEPDHTIESNGYAFNVIGSNWRSNGFANFLGENCLRIAENVRATLNHAPFAPSSIEATGAAIQFAFATANIKDKNAHLMECYDENSGAGFYITGNEIAIYCKNGVRSLEKRRFEQSTKINVSIVAEPATIAYERAGIKYSLLSLYLNGEFVATIGYPTGSNNLFNEKNISFYGTKGDFYLYYIEAWNTYFEWAQAFKNSLVKLTDTEVMVREYEFENVLVSQAAEGRTMMRPSAAELYARGIPYVVEVDSEEKFNEFDGGVSTSDNFEIDLYYYHPTMPWRSFVARKVRKRRQGTTSAKRPKKNPRYYLDKATSIEPLFPEYTNADALLTYALFAKKKVRVGENTIPVDLITIKIDFSDASGVNDCGICDMTNSVIRALGGRYLTPAQRFFDGTYDLDDIHIEGLQLNHSTANHPVAVYRSTSDTLQNVYFEARGNWKEDKNEQVALGLMNTPGYNKGCLNYQDESFVEFIGNDGETLDQIEARFKATSGLDTDMPYLLSLYCGRNYRFMRYVDGQWKNTTGSMYQPNGKGGKWVIEGDVLNPVEGFEYLIYQDMCWCRGVSSVADMMAPSSMKSSWVQKLIDKGSISGDAFPAWTYYFESLIDNDQLAIDYAMGRKVPYQLFDWLLFCNSCDSTVSEGWSNNWKNNLYKHASPHSTMLYYGDCDYNTAKDQLSKNKHDTWFLEDGASVIKGVYSDNALIMYSNKLYDGDGANDKDNDGGCDTDPEVDPGKPTTDTYTNPFAGWYSVPWVCCREVQEAFLADGTSIDLRTVVANMRNCQCEVDGRTLKPFSPEGALYFYCEKRQKVWPKVVSSYDGYRKYIHYTSTADSIYFYALQGLGLTSLPWFIRTRWRIRDGYYQTGDFFSGVLSGRIACAANATITIKAAATGYFGIGNDASGNLSESCYLEAGESYTFTNFKKDNGTLLYIYQADRIAEIDLSQLSLSNNFDFSVMKLVEKIATGSAIHSETSMSFTALTAYTLGELPFLKCIDIRGTRATLLDCSKCPRIEQILATGSQLTTLTLAETSPINDIALPTTMTEMRIVGLPNLYYTPAATTGLQIASMPAVVKVWVENSPNYNAMAMIAHIVQSQTGSPVLAMVRVVNQENLTGNGSELKALIERGVGGMDIDGNKTAMPVIEGEYLITSILEQYEIDAIEAGIRGITIVEGLAAYIGVVNEVNGGSYTGDADADIEEITLENVGEYIKEYNCETYSEYLEHFAIENMDINETV